MGSSDFYPEEGPVREVYVDESMIDLAPGSRNLVATASVTAPLASPRLCTTTIGRLAKERPYKSQTA